MPDPFYPGAVQIAGAFRSYGAGRIAQLLTALRHYTVGVNSIGTCGRDFQLLQARDGTLYQGAPVDAVCWGAGDPWNHRAVHIEAEWHPVYNADEPILNDAMIGSLAGLALWLETDWSIRRDASYDGPDRVALWDGWIDHGKVIQTGDWHTNFWPADQWARVAAGGAPPPPTNDWEPHVCTIINITDPHISVPANPDGYPFWRLDDGPTLTPILTESYLRLAEQVGHGVVHWPLNQTSFQNLADQIARCQASGTAGPPGPPGPQGPKGDPGGLAGPTPAVLTPA